VLSCFDLVVIVMVLGIEEWSIGAEMTEGEPGLAIRSLTLTVLFGGLRFTVVNPKYLCKKNQES